MNRQGDEPRSRLRRLLKRAEEFAAQQLELTGISQTADGKRGTGDASPVRPAPPNFPTPPDPITPKPRSTQTVAVAPAGVEERLQAEAALEGLREKTAEIANEFASGKLNRAQFTAMYASYNERRVIIEQLLARDPDSQAWQRVARPGQTGFLRQHFEARILSYTIYNYNVPFGEALIATHGTVPLIPGVGEKILAAMNVIIQDRGNPGALRKSIDGGRWIAIVPGKYTVGIALFSLEPSEQQFRRVQDIHADFERANRVVLDRGIRVPEQLVFPDRALFEKPAGNS